MHAHTHTHTHTHIHMYTCTHTLSLSLTNTHTQPTLMIFSNLLIWSGSEERRSKLMPLARSVVEGMRCSALASLEYSPRLWSTCVTPHTHSASLGYFSHPTVCVHGQTYTETEYTLDMQTYVKWLKQEQCSFEITYCLWCCFLHF